MLAQAHKEAWEPARHAVWGVRAEGRRTVARSLWENAASASPPDTCARILSYSPRFVDTVPLGVPEGRGGWPPGADRSGLWTAKTHCLPPVLMQAK